VARLGIETAMRPDTATALTLPVTPVELEYLALALPAPTDQPCPPLPSPAETRYELLREAMTTAQTLLAGHRPIAAHYGAHASSEELRRSCLPALAKLATEAGNILQAGALAATHLPEGPDLVSPLRHLAGDLSKLFWCHVVVDVERPRPLPPVPTRVLYLAAYQAVIGAVRDAWARTVTLLVVFDDSEVRLSAADEGRPLQSRRAAQEGYDRLSRMLTDAGGAFAVMNMKKGGVRLRARCPVDYDDEVALATHGPIPR
jgi:hypothetical protein